VVEKTFTKRSKSSTFVVAKIISVLLGRDRVDGVELILSLFEGPIIGRVPYFWSVSSHG